eukprot:1181609-Prorocentrum_minimum.AAC.2
MARRGEKHHVVPIYEAHGTTSSSGDWHEDELVSSYLDDQSQLYFKVLVAGEVGIGKTTLAATLANTLQGQCYTPATMNFDESRRFVLTFPSGARPRCVRDAQSRTSIIIALRSRSHLPAKDISL